MDEAKLEALKNRRMKGIDLTISITPSKDGELAPGAPEKEEDNEAPEGTMPDLKEDVAEGEAPDMAAAMKQHEMGQDEQDLNGMLEGTSFAKRFKKKVG